MVPIESQLNLNVPHFLERTELWFILIIGESVISLVDAENYDQNYNFYLTEILGFFVVVKVLDIYMRMSPDHHSSLEMSS